MHASTEVMLMDRSCEERFVWVHSFLGARYPCQLEVSLPSGAL